MKYDLISRDMLEQNRGLHEQGNYGASGWRHFEPVLMAALCMDNPVLLDYGCGQCTLSKSLYEAGWKGLIREYDPCVSGKDAMPEPADLVICTDVMEHVEENRVPNVFDHMRSLTKRLCYVSIAIRPANKSLPNGMNAHITQRKPKWWVKKASKAGWSQVFDKSYEKHDEPYEVRLWMIP